MEPARDPAVTLPAFDYFMLRLRRSELAPSRLSGVIERLGSGEKRQFDTGEQLVNLVQGWLDSAHPPRPEEIRP